MNRSDLHRLAEIRLNEARILLDNGSYSGAYYLAGYAVECALKACIAKQVQQYDFPDKELAQKNFTHKLTDLVDVARLGIALTSKIQASHGFAANWNIVKDWREVACYDPAIREVDARALYIEISDPSDGVLIWLTTYW